MSQTLLIVNPAAGAGKTLKSLPSVRQTLDDQAIRYEMTLTEGRGHAITLAQQAAERGYKTIIAVGGDGTINEIVNGIHNANALGSTQLGIISTGTGADYIRTLGIPRNIPDACMKFISPVVKKVDLGVVRFDNPLGSSRLFVNFAGLGFDADIVKRTTLKYKSMGKVSAYLLALFTTLVSYRNRDITMQIGQAKTDYRICTVIMGNGKYGGGGMLTTPEAALDDGLLDVLIIGDLTKPDLVKSLPMIYKGTHLSHPKVELKKVSEIHILARDPVSIQADGDIIGEIPATFSIMPLALNLII